MRRVLDGSSPRTWGIHPDQASSPPQKRFIPTNVGNTIDIAIIGATLAVHPHERGEYSGRKRDTGFANRFIPTNVGNTRSIGLRWDRRSVHPHERGEYALHLARETQPGGSSPRTWGIRRPTRVQAVRLRFIPTNVGNTCNAQRPFDERSVHPHERGEYTVKPGNALFRIGSSPRTWGIRNGQTS